MSNLNAAKPRVKTITLNDGVEREIKFTLNAMAELEDRYGSVENAFKALESNSIKAARCILWAGLLHSDEGLTEQQVGNLIDLDILNEVMESMTEAMGNDMPDKKEGAQQLPNA